jgi:hypothetical protein
VQCLWNCCSLLAITSTTLFVFPEISDSTYIKKIKNFKRCVCFVQLDAYEPIFEHASVISVIKLHIFISWSSLFSISDQ